MRKKIKDATLAEIRAFALDEHGVDIHARCTKETAISRLEAVWENDWIDVDDDAPPAQPERRKEDQFYLIQIPTAPNSGADQYVPIGVNGQVMLIKRGVKSEIRRPYFEVLQNAIEQRIYQRDEEDLESEMVESWVPSYPFSLLEGPYYKDADGNKIDA